MKKLLAMLMTVAMGMTTFSGAGSMSLTAKAFTGEENKDAVGKSFTEEYDYIALNNEMEQKSCVTDEENEDYAEFYGDAEVEPGADEIGEQEFPPALDWSEDESFPAIGDQSINGNCGYWSNYYYSVTFLYNKAKGIKTTPDSCLNPIFGFAFYGRSLEDSEAIAQDIGYPTMGALPLDHYGTNTFSPTKEVWEDALLHRVERWASYKNFGEEDSIITGPKDPSLNMIKKTLSDGHFIGVGSLSARWNYSVIPEGKYKGELAIDRCDGEGYGGHGLSIIGYNDEIWIDVNYDGKKQEAEIGAFKLVNSWGPDWGNKGFVWAAYDAFNATSQILTSEEEKRINNAIAAGNLKAEKVDNSTRVSFFMGPTFGTPYIREKDTSNCLCYMTVNTGSRKEMKMSVTATHKKDKTAHSYNFPSLPYDSEEYAWDGTKKSTDATMVFDLDNVIPDISPETMEDYTWEVTFGNEIKNSYALTVKDLCFKVEGTKKYVTSISKIPLNGTQRTYNMALKTGQDKEDETVVKEDKSNVIIYYSNSGFKDANIHYRIGNGAWTTAPGIQMCEDSSQDGYTWKYVVNLGSESTLTACFNEKNKTWDSNNNSNYVLKPGCYGIKNGKITELKEPVKIPDPTIELEKSKVTLKEEEKVMLKATVVDGSLSDIVWKSSDDKVATVSVDGEICGVGKGTAIITATIKEVSVSCEVTVEEKKKVETKITLNKTSLHLTQGMVEQLEAVVTGDTENSIVWKSTKEEVAIVLNTGKILAVGIGTATITATIDGVSASCHVTVHKNVVEEETEEVKATAITLSETTLLLKVGETKQLAATVKGETKNRIEWGSSNEEVIVISNSGKIVATGVGEATVTASIDGLNTSCRVTVEKKPAEDIKEESERPKANGIELDRTSVVMQEGNVTQLTATVKGKTENKVVWISSNENVVIVSDTGKSVAVGEGKADITATIDGISVSCEVTVQKKTVTEEKEEIDKTEEIKAAGLTLDESILQLEKGTVHTLTANVKGETKNPVLWTSSDEKVAMVSGGGKIIAISAGNTVITATVDGFSASCSVSVTETKLSLNKQSYVLYTEGRKSIVLQAMVNGEIPSDPQITWYSSNSDVAAVSTNGAVTAKKKGTVIITAEDKNGLKAECRITVKKPSLTLKTKKVITLKKGKTLQIVAVSTPGGTFKYTSSSKKIVTVSKKGIVKAKKKGKVYITVSRNGVKKKIKVVVK